jgi:predicted DNA-binding antitoxin AbrB/MazE fold protein
MVMKNELAVVYESGVLRPEDPLNLPDRTRLVIAIRRIDTTPQAEAQGRELLHEIRRRGVIRLGGWRPTRDEIHERG